MVDPRRAAIDRPEDHVAIAALFRELIDAWSRRDAAEVARHFSNEAEMVAANGRRAQGAAAIQALLERSFEETPSAQCVAAVTRTRKISFHVGVLHGCVASRTPDGVGIDPETAELWTFAASSEYGYWQIELFQSTRARLDDCPDLVEALAREVRRTSS